MDLHVCPQAVSLAERLATGCACKHINRIMGTQVYLHLLRAVERFVTTKAVKGLLSCMFSFVYPKFKGFYKRLTTVGTDIGLFSGMNLLVSLQALRMGKIFVTLGTGKES